MPWRDESVTTRVAGRYERVANFLESSARGLPVSTAWQRLPGRSGDGRETSIGVQRPTPKVGPRKYSRRGARAEGRMTVARAWMTRIWIFEARGSAGGEERQADASGAAGRDDGD